MIEYNIYKTYEEIREKVVAEFQLDRFLLPSLDDVIESFHRKDLNGDGKITMEEALDSGVRDEVVKIIFGEDGYDLDSDGGHTKQEFVCGYYKHFVTEQLLDSFMEFDEDGTGTLDRDELEAFLASINVHGGAAVQEFIEEHDKDKDGNISLDEFKKYSNKKLMNIIKEIMPTE